MRILPLALLLSCVVAVNAADAKPSAGEVRRASAPVSGVGGGRAAVFVNGRAVQFDTPLQMRDGRLYVPVRAISEAAGAIVRYNARTAQISIQRGKSVVLFDPPSNSPRVLVPLRFIGETLGATLAVGKRDGIMVVDVDWGKGDFKVRPEQRARPTQSAQSSAPTAPLDNGEFAAAAQHNLNRINFYRARAGAPALKLDARISAFARQGSLELQANHEPHGHFRRADVFASGFSGGAAENQGDPNGWPLRGGLNATIDAIMQAMIDEGPGGGHHDNMLNPKFRRVGVGLIVDGNGLYLTNDFSE